MTRLTPNQKNHLRDAWATFGTAYRASTLYIPWWSSTGWIVVQPDLLQEVAGPFESRDDAAKAAAICEAAVLALQPGETIWQEVN